MQSQIGWIFKSKANESYCLYNSGLMVRYYALYYGFRTFLNPLKNPLLERHMAFVCFHIQTNATYLSKRDFSTDSRTYRSHTKGHSVGPLVLTLFIGK